MQTTERRYDIDALRVLAFGLLILYHTGMLYVSGWDWHLKSSYLSESLQFPMLLLNRWRMPLLFLISGLAVNFLRSKSGFGQFIAQRSRRLLIPLVIGILVVVPIQPYCEAVTKGAVEPGFLQFLLRYYPFHPWPTGAFAWAEFGFTWNHLWYIPYLWVYTVCAVPLIAFFETAPGRRIREVLLSARGVWLLLLPAVPKAIYRWHPQPCATPCLPRWRCVSTISFLTKDPSTPPGCYWGE